MGEVAVYVACSTRCFERFPLDRALRLIGEMEFSKLDVAIVENSNHLKPSEVAEDVALAAQRIRIGPSLSPAAFDIEFEPSLDEEEVKRQLRAICKLARLTSVSVLTISAPPVDSDLAVALRRLKSQVAMVEGEGLVLALATRTGTMTERPATAIELCEKVTGLGITLDPSHLINGPNQGAAFDELFPYVRHVHLRDTGKSPGKFQVRIGQGEVEYGRILSLLQRSRYDRLLSVAIHDIADAPYSMESEVRKLKFLLESLT